MRAAVALLCLCAGCTSIQWLDGDGQVRSIGLARVAAAPAAGGATRIVAPGASLRFIPGLSGYAIGWRETVLFQVPDDDGRRRLAAFGERLYGLRLDPFSLMLGSEHRFAVLQPPPGAALVQDIHYFGSGGPLRGRIALMEAP